MSSVMGRATSAAYGIFDRAWTAACWPLIGFLNLIFRPDPETGAVAWWKTGGWVIANTALLSFAVTQLDWRNMFWTLVAFLVIHILIMISSLRIMYEEKRVMEGSMKPEAMRFSAFDAVNDMSILASSVVFYVVGLAALIEAIERSGMAQILRHKPTLNSEYTEYLACVLNEVPIVNSVVNAAANYFKYSDNVTAQIVYNGWEGNGIRLLIVATVSIIVVRAMLLRVQQWTQQVSMAHAMETGTVSPEGVKKRLVRVPTTLNGRLMAVGANPSRHDRAQARAVGDGEARGPALCARLPDEARQPHRARSRAGAHPRDAGHDEPGGAREDRRRVAARPRPADGGGQGRHRLADASVPGQS